ncbi:hypothetical protein RHGRI_013282 [Rhododendron griersonianum]|uniref:DNA topoisomerase (ATP-hydrolyzing) n=1 Tax=Rhododendron griersonianum TaxID=479676 RepID=A0AAV6K501_9ERIC|nr:hypothetical protein RHGRI_013282 [Rhododendron griersonianum]
MILKAIGKTSSGKMNKMGKQLSLPSARRKLKQERIGSDTLRFEPGTYLDQKEKLIKYNDFSGQYLRLQVAGTYMPMIPLLVVNGSEGIETGWSSNILNYSSRDIVANVSNRTVQSNYYHS